MPKISVIDDDENLLKAVETTLNCKGFEVLSGKDGQEGLKVAFASHPDLVILDIMLPKIDGIGVIRRLQELCDIPIIILTAVASESDIVRGLGIGADDYITKPHSAVELVARVRSVLRHGSAGARGPAALLDVGSLSIDMARHKVIVDGEPVNLTPTEFRLLSYLARSPGCVIPHRTLLLEISGPEYRDQTDYLHLYIRYLRERIERNPSAPETIKTKRGVGYYLDAP